VHVEGSVRAVMTPLAAQYPASNADKAGGVEPLIYAVAAAIAFVVAVLAGVPSARRAAGVQPIVAMRTE
jgi:ABC-type antimicrobial peptide transport system permease subunit